MKRIAIAIAIAILGPVSLPRAEAAVYWGNGGPVSVANLDGSSPFFDFSPGLDAGACGLAASPSHLYWANWTGISRIDLNSGGVNRFFISGTDKPCGLAVDDSHVYWANWGNGIAGGSLGRANLDGTGVEDITLSGVLAPCGLAVSSEHIYWASIFGVGRVRLDGSKAEPAFLPEVSGCPIAAENEYIYWGNPSSQTIGRAKLDGAEVNEDFIRDVGNISGVAVNATHIYWVNKNAPTGSVGIAEVGGSVINRDLVVTNRPGQESIALDSRPAEMRPSQISRGISFGEARRDRRKGAVTFDVAVPERGDLMVTSPPIRWKVIKGLEPPPNQGGASEWTLKLWAGRTGTFAKRIRRKLKRTGRASLTFQFTYAEMGRFPVSGSKKVTLIKRKPVRRKQRRRK